MHAGMANVPKWLQMPIMSAAAERRDLPKTARDADYRTKITIFRGSCVGACWEPSLLSLKSSPQLGLRAGAPPVASAPGRGEIDCRPCWPPGLRLEWLRSSQGHVAHLLRRNPATALTPADRKPTSSPPREVPTVVVSRLSLYLRELQHLVGGGRATVSSNQLGKLLGFTASQVRKDLAFFGHFGQPGIGYRCQELIEQIRQILGTDRQWTVTMVGVGNLGRALLRYKGFAAQGFRIVAAFDLDPRLCGTKLEDVPVFHQDRLSDVVRQQRIQLGVITVPAFQAQQVADKLVSAGIQGILNFAPVTLSLPEKVSVVGVDLATEMEQLAFSVANRIQSR